MSTGHEGIKIRMMDDLAVELNDGVCVIRMRGVLNRQIALSMRDEMARFFDQGVAQSVIVDISEVQRMDSMGVGLLVSAFRSCQSRNVPFALVGVSERAGEILRITGLDNILPIHGTEDEAREDMAAEAPPQG